MQPKIYNSTPFSGCHVLFFFFLGKFHKVLFLAPGGRTVFLGCVSEAENYFEMLGFQIPEKVNPADFYMDVIGGLCKGSDESTSTLPERWEQYAAGITRALKTLTVLMGAGQVRMTE